MCNTCDEKIITVPVGPQGPQGIQGIPGENGTNGNNGENGEDGQRILYSYASTGEGISNDSAIGPSTVLSHVIPANTLINDGDELEIYIYLAYYENGLVNLRLKFSGTEFFTYAVQNAANDIRILKFKITRVSSTSQLWTMDALVKDITNSRTQLVDVATTSFDLATNSTFQLELDNLELGINQVLIRKFTIYLNKI